MTKHMKRINVPLNDAEAAAILKMAETHYRHPREQARLLLREALASHGLLISTTTPDIQPAHHSADEELSYADNGNESRS